MLGRFCLDFVGIIIPKKVYDRLESQTRSVSFFIAVTAIVSMIQDVVNAIIKIDIYPGGYHKLLTWVIPMHIAVIALSFLVWVIINCCKIHFPAATIITTSVGLVIKYLQWVKLYRDFVDVGPSYFFHYG